eukprot:CAMPEP_0179024238 /NCGR_PEP_ID=MMETSP0796-20121207/7352_1 /TAXON_ID=73915 /ORGANISM="Pyrodinium bahamense, Strain pbaha01" /LENGTH=630 /DNA_ID=CAMNT_0020720193 /DNA_START=42 /DNA_END=1931 /DNA_ORIENTATION=-
MGPCLDDGQGPAPYGGAVPREMVLSGLSPRIVGTDVLRLEFEFAPPGCHDGATSEWMCMPLPLDRRQGHDHVRAKAGDATPSTTCGWQSPQDVRSPRDQSSSGSSPVASRSPSEVLEPVLSPWLDDALVPAAVAAAAVRSVSHASRRAVYSVVAMHLLDKVETPLSVANLPLKVGKPPTEVEKLNPQVAKSLREERMPPPEATSGTEAGGFFSWLFGFGAAPQPASQSAASSSKAMDLPPEVALGNDSAAELPVKALSQVVRRAIYDAAARHPLHKEDSGTSHGFFSWLFGSGGTTEPALPGQRHEGRPGLRLEDLHQIGLLGEGAFGSVYLVRCEVSSRILALKVTSKESLAERGLQHTVRNERSVLAASRSPFVLRIEAHFDSPRYFYILLEAALGGTLCTLYDRLDLFGSEVHARFYAACMLSALEHLHALGWVYRDLKTENVVLDARGYAKLCDFGTAKLLSGSLFQHTYTICGTLEYMAPEILPGCGYSFPVDWFALGVFIYELLVGETPFAAEENAQILAKMRRGIDEVHFPSAEECSWPELVKGLCRSEPNDRLPMLSGGVANIKKQVWFMEGGFDLHAHEQCRMVPPHLPDVSNPKDLCDLRISGTPSRSIEGSEYKRRSEW